MVAYLLLIERVILVSHLVTLILVGAILLELIGAMSNWSECSS